MAIGACSDSSDNSEPVESISDSSKSSKPASESGIQWADNCNNASGMVLFNGDFHTMDANKSSANSVRLQDNLIKVVSQEDAEAIGVDGDCKIDLAGRTVIPGLIENHNHILHRGTKPGHMVFNMDSARTWSDALELIKKQIDLDNIPLPEEGTVGTQDNFVTVIGAISPGQFAEGDLPDFETLNQIAHPVYIEGSYGFESYN